ncbi:MAG: response regulator [Bacteroidales bacterium]|nr:response regulator [Bacteroidales bacterium]
MFTLRLYSASGRRMLKSLKNRLLAWFLLIAFAIASIVFPLNYLHKQKEIAIRNVVDELNELHISYIKDLKITSEFLAYEINNPDFFITGESPYLSIHNSINDSLHYLIDQNINNLDAFSPVKKNVLLNISNAYSDYCTLFDSIVYNIYQRGYRDLGLEGEMISYIYQIESHPKIRNAIFNIRKNEREYLNRNDSAYAVQVIKLTGKLIADITNSTSFNSEEKPILTTQLHKYLVSFNKLISLDSKLGIRTNKGLKTSLYKKGEALENLISKSIADAKVFEYAQISRLNVLFALLSVLFILFAACLGLYLSRYLLNHLTQLTNYISQLSVHNFNYNAKLNLRKSSSEIRGIYKEFRNMIAQLKIREKQRDIALLKATDSEKRYRDLTDLLPQSIFETDKLGNLIYVNKAWYNAFGYSQNDLEEGLNLIEILQTNTNNALIGLNKVENSDYEAIRKNGTKFPALVYSDTVCKENNIVGRRGIIIDATLRNKYIETLQKETVRAINSDKHKSSFLANMSHEIRTPMNSILGFSNLLSQSQVSEDQKNEFIQYINSSGQILLNLIDDIIDIAKIEAGEIKIKRSNCYPKKLINELCMTFEGYKASIGKEKIQLQTSLPNDEIVFHTDQFRLKQILSNLISNAIKFTNEGQVSIALKNVNDRILEFSVEDTGVGLTKEQLNVVFNRFKRADIQEDTNVKGTGLGLSISKNLVELLGGQMWVSSVPGEGTRFWFQLPFERIHDTNMDIIPDQIHLKDQKYNWNNYTFLVAEDDDNSYVYLKELLQKTKVRLVRAVNGKEVVEAVKFSDEIDIVLMDIQMPYKNGYEATKEIKALKPGLPVIAQTAFAMEGDKEKSIIAGCDDYITKPLNPNNLYAKIDQFLPVNKIKSSLNDEESIPEEQPKLKARNKQ